MVGQVQALNRSGEVVVASVYRETPEFKGRKETPPRLDLLIPFIDARSFFNKKGKPVNDTFVNTDFSPQCRHGEQFVFLDEDAEILREFARKFAVRLDEITTDASSDVSGSNQ